jgi:hypothetical protein
MINTAEMSLVANMLTDRAIKYLQETGGLYPALYFFNKDKPLKVELTDKETKLLINSEEDEIGMFNIYATVQLCNNDSQQEAVLNKLTKDIVKRYNPDAVGLILVALYKEYTEKEYKKMSAGGSIALDPESIRTIHSCFYVRGQKTANTRIIPILDRSGDKKDLISEDLVSLEDSIDEARKHLDIHTAHTPWSHRETKITPWLKYPY